MGIFNLTHRWSEGFLKLCWYLNLIYIILLICLKPVCNCFQYRYSHSALWVLWCRKEQMYRHEQFLENDLQWMQRKILYMKIYEITQKLTNMYKNSKFWNIKKYVSIYNSCNFCWLSGAPRKRWERYIYRFIKLQQTLAK